MLRGESRNEIDNQQRFLAQHFEGNVRIQSVLKRSSGTGKVQFFAQGV